MKVLRRQNAGGPLVLWAVSGIILLGMGLLAAELWKLQGPRRGEYESDFVRQSVRRIRLPAIRGKIYDSRNVCLADNAPSYSIALYTEELRAPRSTNANTMALLHQVSEALRLPMELTYRQVREHVENDPDSPLVAWKNPGADALERWKKKIDEWTAGSTEKRRRKDGLPDAVAGDSIVVLTRELRDAGTTTAANTLELACRISDAIGLPLEITYRDIVNHINARRPLPFLAWQNIDSAAMARWAEHANELRGSDIVCNARRVYPRGADCSHLVGYLGRRSPDEIESDERIDLYLPDEQGRTGLEALYDNFLSGEAGGKLVQIDVSGFRFDDLSVRPPRRGGDLQLALDADIQRYACEALATNRGAVVVLDPHNGDVLAIASSPSYDDNRIRSATYYRQQLDNPDKPLIFRAAQACYPPGSTFKPIVSLAALTLNPGFAQTNYVCEGYFHVGNQTKACWIKRPGHGEINLRQALMHSCNIYMYNLGLAIGYPQIHDMARQFGIGEKTNADLARGVEKAGNLPDRSVNDVDLCNLSIGQGALLATPLQMAVVAAALANGGDIYRPRIVRGIRYADHGDFQAMPTERLRHIDLSPAALATVRGGMYDVVMDEDGTAKEARVPGVEIAGKTGSAQYPKGYDRESKRTIYGVQTWMISFAPFDAPRYAVAFIVEDGVSGGRTVGPRLGQLYRNIFAHDGTLEGGRL